MTTRTMWMYKRPVSGRPSEPFGEITEVEVTVGRKYFNLPYPNNEWNGYRHQFEKEVCHDRHGIPYYEEHSDYSTKHILFETLEHAERHKEYDEICKRLDGKNLHNRLYSMPMTVLKQIETCLDYGWNDVVPLETVSVPLKDNLGTLCATVGGDQQDYPEIYVYVRRPDESEIDVVAVEGVSDEEFKGVKACLYKDTSRDDYVDDFKLSKEELEIDME